MLMLIEKMIIEGNSPYLSAPPFPPELPINGLAPVAPHISESESRLIPNHVDEITTTSLALFDNCDYLALSEGTMTWNFDALDNFEKTFGSYHDAPQ